jgi:hypothetical protein
MLRMTEVYYYNTARELQKLELYNVSSSEFLQKLHNGFNVFCTIENGSIIYSSYEFGVVEEYISVLMTDLISQSK